ncbi:hypothetical protein TNCV_3477831 [Trichonephila clavipes]|nr:hypothetical protein TNCV_3477831 [Trichonephila clavipes]
MFTRIESSSSIIPTSLSKSVIQTPSDSHTALDAKKYQNLEQGKENKNYGKNEDAIIEIKMAPHRQRKQAPEEYTTDEENMINYYVEEDEMN